MVDTDIITYIYIKSKGAETCQVRRKKVLGC